MITKLTTIIFIVKRALLEQIYTLKLAKGQRPNEKIKVNRTSGPMGAWK